VCNFIGAMVLAMVRISIPEYTVQPWHQWLCYTAVLWLAVSINIFGSRFLPDFNKFIRKHESLSLTGHQDKRPSC
jgi:choline transport protein